MSVRESPAVAHDSINIHTHPIIMAYIMIAVC